MYNAPAAISQRRGSKSLMPNSQSSPFSLMALARFSGCVANGCKLAVPISHASQGLLRFIFSTKKCTYSETKITGDSIHRKRSMAFSCPQFLAPFVSFGMTMGRSVQYSAAAATGIDFMPDIGRQRNTYRTHVLSYLEVLFESVNLTIQR